VARLNPLLRISCREAGHFEACRQAGEEASPDHGDSRDRSVTEAVGSWNRRSRRSASTGALSWTASTCPPATKAMIALMTRRLARTAH